MKSLNMNKNITRNTNFYDDAVKYVICWAFFLISTKEKSILFSILSIIMLGYFIGYEYKNVIKYLSEYKRGKQYFLGRFIISISILIIKMDLTGKAIFVIVYFINIYLLIVSIIGPLIWNENIYFDDKANNLWTLFATKNGEYSRTIYVIHELGLELPFSNKYTSVAENINYLDKLAGKISILSVHKLEKLNLILSSDSEKNKFKSLLCNCVYFFIILIVTGKASIQLGAISGIDIGAEIKNRIPVIIALLLSLIVIFPLIIKMYKDVQTIKNRKLLLIIIKRAIQIKKENN